jgi:hypothetical protein
MPPVNPMTAALHTPVTKTSVAVDAALFRMHPDTFKLPQTDPLDVRGSSLWPSDQTV